MRKLVAIFIMIFVVVFFYNSIQRRQPKNKMKKDTTYAIHEIKNILEEDYPSNPIEVVEINNEIVNMIYGKTLKEEELAEVVKLQRMLYAESFLALNPMDSHMLEIEREIAMNAGREIKIIASKVMNSYNDPPGTMRVQVVHYTNKQGQDLVREYIVKEEKEAPPAVERTWKIYGWENIGTIKAQEEEE